MSDRFEPLAGRTSDGRGLRIAQRYSNFGLEQILNRLDRFIVLRHGNDRPHPGDIHSLFGEALLVSRVRVKIVGRQKQIGVAELVDLKLVEQRVRSAVLKIDMNAVFLLVFLRNFLDGNPQPGCAEHGQTFPLGRPLGTAEVQQDAHRGNDRRTAREKCPQGVDASEPVRLKVQTGLRASRADHGETLCGVERRFNRRGMSV